MPDSPAVSIRGGRVIDPAAGLDEVTDLHLADGAIAGLGPPPADFEPQRIIDATGLVVCPGLVDLSARLRQPGCEHKATVASETRAAAAAGITTLCCPPDTLPPVDTPAVAQLIRQLAEERGHARVLPAGALTRGLDGEQISEMAALKLAGCPVMSNADRPVRDTRVLRRALEYASTYGLCTFLHPADAYLSEGGLVHEGRMATQLGLPGIPEAAEVLGVARDLALAEQTGARVHFRGLSTGRATAMLAEARSRRLPVSADVAAHQLWLTEDALAGFNADARLIPPLRTAADRDALRAAVAAGEITAICSDHQPHEPDAKLNPFPAAGARLGARGCAGPVRRTRLHHLSPRCHSGPPRGTAAGRRCRGCVRVRPRGPLGGRRRHAGEPRPQYTAAGCGDDRSGALHAVRRAGGLRRCRCLSPRESRGRGRAGRF
jgi:dihydroorotase